MKNRDKIIVYFDNISSGTVVVANDLFEKHFLKMGQDAFFRALERLNDDGIIVRIGKGLYIKRADKDKDLDEILLNYFFGEDNARGMFIGYRLYNKYRITSTKNDTVELFSEVIRTKEFNVGHIRVRKPGVILDFENTRIIEALEILQNYYSIDGLDKNKFARYAKQFARGYNDEVAVYVISNTRYKKSTIAFMKKILDMYKVENSLMQFLSYSSKYKVPMVLRVAR